MSEARELNGREPRSSTLLLAADRPHSERIEQSRARQHGAEYCSVAPSAILRLLAVAAAVLLGVSMLESRAAAEEPGKEPPKDAGKTAPKKDSPADPAKTPGKDAPAENEPRPADGSDLRTLIGVNPVGLKRVEVPRMPAMSLRGFVKTSGQPPLALLEITDLNRVFLVKVGTEIPLTIAGRISPIGRNELTGLGGPGRTPAAPANAGDGREQSQIILKVLKVSGEGVTVEAGLLAQTIVIR